MSVGLWLQLNNGTRYNLEDLRNLKESSVGMNSKLKKLIKIFDLDGQNGVEIKNSKGKNEWNSVFKELIDAAKGDNVLTEIEFEEYIAKKQAEKKITDIKFTQEDLNDLLDLAQEPLEEKKFEDARVWTKGGQIQQAIRLDGNGIPTAYFYKKTDRGYEVTTQKIQEYKDVENNDVEKAIVTTFVVTNIDEKGNFDPQDIIAKQVFNSELNKKELNNEYIITRYNNGIITSVEVFDKDENLKSTSRFIYKDGKVIKLEKKEVEIEETDKDGNETTKKEIIETKFVADSVDEEGKLQGITKKITRHSDGNATIITFTGEQQTILKVKNMTPYFEYKESDIISETTNKTEPDDEKTEEVKTDNTELQTILEYMLYPGASELKYDAQTIKTLFESLGKENGEYEKLGEDPPTYAKRRKDGSISQTIRLNDSSAAIEYGTALKSTHSGREYVITFQEKGNDKNKYYHFNPDGTFKYVVITDDKQLNVQNILYPNGEMDIIETQDGKQAGKCHMKKGEDNNYHLVSQRGYEWDENGRIKSTVTLYTDLAEEPLKNKKVIALNDGTMYYYSNAKSDKEGEYSVLNEVRTATSVPILNEKNEIVGYQPISTMTADNNGRVKNTTFYTREQLAKELEVGQHYDYSKINNELRATAANNIIQTLDNAIYMLEASKQGKSFMDLSVWIDKIGESVDEAIARLKGMKEQAEMMLLTVHNSNEELDSLDNNEHLNDELTFATIYENLTGNAWDDKEKDKYQKFDNNISKIGENLSSVFNEYKKNGTLSEKTKALFATYSKDKEFDETKFNDFIKQAEAARKNAVYSELHKYLTGKDWEGEEWNKNPDITKKSQELLKLADEYRKNNNTLTDDIKTQIAKILGKKDLSDEKIERYLNTSINVPLTGTALGYELYTQNSKELLKMSEMQIAINKINSNQGNKEDIAFVLDIVATAGEFKLISLGIGAVGKLLSSSVRLMSKVEKVGKAVNLTQKLLESERFAGTVQFIKQANISAMNFVSYDVMREAGRQMYNDEELDTGKLEEAAIHGAEMGYAMPIVSSGMRYLGKGISRALKLNYVADRTVIEEEITAYRKKCMEKGKQPEVQEINRIRQELMSGHSFKHNTGRVIAGYFGEAFHFGIAGFGVQMFDSAEMREQIKAARIGNPTLEKLSDKDIDNMSKTDMMRAMLEMQGYDTEGLSDIELYAKYAGVDYINQLQNIGQLKLGDYIVGAFVTKGKVPAGIKGARTEKLEKELILNENGKWCLKSGPKKELSDADVLNMTEHAQMFDALDSRLQNRFNKYLKEPMSAENFATLIQGGKVSKKAMKAASDIGMTVQPKDGKYEVTTSNGKTVTVPDLETVGKIYAKEAGKEAGKEAMSDREFIAILQGKESVDELPDDVYDLGMTIQFVDGKYKVTTKSGGEAIVKDVEKVLEIYISEQNKYIQEHAQELYEKYIDNKAEKYIQDHQIKPEAQEYVRALFRLQAGLPTKERVNEGVNKGEGSNVPTQPIGNDVPAHSATKNFATVHQQLVSEQRLYELYSDESGENTVMIVFVAGERPKLKDGTPDMSKGIPFTYTVYKFDKDGNVQEGFPIEGLTDKVAKRYKLKNHQTVDNRKNRKTDTSGTLNSFIIPLPSGIKRLLNKALTNKADFKASTPDEVRAVIEKWVDDNPYWIKNHQDFIDQLKNLDYENIELHLKHIKHLIDEGIDPMVAFENGYFSSSEGAEAFDYLLKHVPTKQKYMYKPLVYALDSIKAENYKKAKERGLLERINKKSLGNEDYEEINRLAAMTDAEYQIYTRDKDSGIQYVTGNEDLNRLSKAYPDIVGYYSMKDVKNNWGEDYAKIKTVIDKLIAVNDSNILKSALKSTTPEFTIDNYERLNKLFETLDKLDAIENPKTSSTTAEFRREHMLYDSELTLKMYEALDCDNETMLKIANHMSPKDKKNTEFIGQLVLESGLKPENVIKILDCTYGYMDYNPKAGSYRFNSNYYHDLKKLSVEEKAACKKFGVDIDARIQKLQTSVGHEYDVIQIPLKQQQKFTGILYNNNNPKVENFLKTFDFAKFGKDGIPLKYTREQFTQNINELIKDLSENEQDIILSHFGLQKGQDGFDGLMNNKPFENETVSERAKDVANKVLIEIENFTIKNEADIQDKEAKEILDGIIQGCPQFTAIVGKKQHETQDYSIDIHTLKVLQNAMNDPEYQNLTDNEKTILKTVIILHDIAKKGGIIDEEHDLMSTTYADNILKEIPFTQKDETRRRITDLIKSHHWFGNYNSGQTNARIIANRFKRKGDWNIMKIFAKADLEGVGKSFLYSVLPSGVNTLEKFHKYFEERVKPIEEERLNQNTNASPLYTSTKFSGNGDKFDTEYRKCSDGSTARVRVFNMNNYKSGELVDDKGFAKGTKIDDVTELVHMAGEENLRTAVELSRDPIADIDLSATEQSIKKQYSYMNMVFGAVLSGNSSKIGLAATYNLGTNEAWGNGRSINTTIRNLYGQNVTNYKNITRKTIIDELKKEHVSLSEEEYAEVCEYLYERPFDTHIHDFETSSHKTISGEVLKEALQKARKALVKASESEVTIQNPTVTALYAKVKSIDDCPEWFIKMAEEFDLPIILNGNNTRKDLASASYKYTTKAEDFYDDNPTKSVEAQRLQVLEGVGNFLEDYKATGNNYEIVDTVDKNGNQIKLLRFHNNIVDGGNYNYAILTSDGKLLQDGLHTDISDSDMQKVLDNYGVKIEELNFTNVKGKTRRELSSQAGMSIDFGLSKIIGGAIRNLIQKYKSAKLTEKVAEKTGIKEPPSLDILDNFDETQPEPEEYYEKFRELSSTNKAQQQVANYLDYLLQSIPEDTTQSEVQVVNVEQNNYMPTGSQYINYEKNYLLPNGTIIAVKHNSRGKMVQDPATGRFSIVDEYPDINFFIKDINGKTHILPAMTEKNIKKAKRILSYLETQQPLSREESDIKQAELLNKKSQTLHQETDVSTAGERANIRTNFVNKIKADAKSELSTIKLAETKLKLKGSMTLDDGTDLFYDKKSKMFKAFYHSDVYRSNSIEKLFEGIQIARAAADIEKKMTNENSIVNFGENTIIRKLGTDNYELVSKSNGSEDIIIQGVTITAVLNKLYNGVNENIDIKANSNYSKPFESAFKYPAYKFITGRFGNRTLYNLVRESKDFRQEVTDALKITEQKILEQDPNFREGNYSDYVDPTEDRFTSILPDGTIISVNSPTKDIATYLFIIKPDGTQLNIYTKNPEEMKLANRIINYARLNSPINDGTVFLIPEKVLKGMSVNDAISQLTSNKPGAGVNVGVNEGGNRWNDKMNLFTEKSYTPQVQATSKDRSSVNRTKENGIGFEVNKPKSAQAGSSEVHMSPAHVSYDGTAQHKETSRQSSVSSRISDPSKDINIEQKLSVFKNSQGENIFDKKILETIKRDFNEQEQRLLKDIIDKFIEKYNAVTEDEIEMADANPYDVITRDLYGILKSATSEDLPIIKELMEFESNSESDYREFAFDEPDNTDFILPIFLGADHETLLIMKRLADISKEPGTSDLLKNINNLRDIARTMRGKYSLDEIAEIFRMKDENGNPLVGLQTYEDYKNKSFSQIPLGITPERLQSTRQLLVQRYGNEPMIETILSNIKNTSDKLVLEKALTIKNNLNQYIFDLNSICAITSFLTEKPQFRERLEKIIDEISNCNLSPIFNKNFTNILNVINDETVYNIFIRLIRKCDKLVLSTGILGNIAENIQNAQDKTQYISRLLNILRQSGRTTDDTAIARLMSCISDEKSGNIVDNCLTQKIYKPSDMMEFILLYANKRYVNSKLKEFIIEQCIKNNISTQDTDVLTDLLLYDMQNETNQSGFALNMLKLKANDGKNRFSMVGINSILEKLPQPPTQADMDMVYNYAKSNQNATITQIISHVKGKQVEVRESLENPFGEDSKYKSYMDRIKNTSVWMKTFDEVDQAKLHAYLYKLVQDAPNRFERLVDSGYFELCSEGKINIYTSLMINIGTNKFFSKSYLEDVKRIYKGEPLVKHYSEGMKLDNLAKVTPDGEVVSVGEQLYVNDSGKMVKLKMSEKTFERLFPLEQRFNTQQGAIGNCWLVSDFDNFMDMPVGRAKLYQLFEETDNGGITITFPPKQREQIGLAGERTIINICKEFKVPFPYGAPLKTQKQLSGCDGLKMLEQAYSFKRGETPNEDITLDEMSVLTDVDEQIKRLDGGFSEEFICDILGYTKIKIGDKILDISGNVVGERMRIHSLNQKSVNKAIEKIKECANNPNIFLHASTIHITSDSSEKELNIAQSLYSNHAYSIKGFDEKEGKVYYTNPHDSKCILEMDVYEFLKYIDDIIYVRIK